MWNSLCFQLHPLPDASRGGARIRGHRPALKVVAINATSLMAHWRSIATIDADFILITETRSTEAEQQLISRAIKAMDWVAHWGPPIVIKPPGGMSGRSGGTAIFARSYWLPVDSLPLECEAPKQHFQNLVFEHQINRRISAITVYYGHPEMKEITMRDLMRLEMWTAHSELDMILGGDVNVDDTDDYSIPVDGGWADALCWWSSRKGHPLEATFHTKTAARRLDRLFISQHLTEALSAAYVDQEVLVPGHSAVVAQFALQSTTHRVQVARPSLIDKQSR